MINDLVIREYDPKDIKEKTKLDRLRKEIDMLDDEIMNILASRMKIAQEIGAYKKENNMTILQSERWKEVLQKFVERGKQNGLSEEFITRIIKSIHDESIEQQESVMTSE